MTKYQIESRLDGQWSWTHLASEWSDALYDSEEAAQEAIDDLISSGGDYADGEYRIVEVAP